ncbi:hypothetical protein CEXT_452431 [Caerostris extrusa]|uniref:Uncharacterized protein n=1 Tax=Caerostris extrusa TaxID=172846 RepID=A0AAV4TE33_CAEEX|nr:hypothetical protein CEXT_452431 [Caerostris extrusa]
MKHFFRIANDRFKVIRTLCRRLLKTPHPEIAWWKKRNRLPARGYPWAAAEVFFLSISLRPCLQAAVTEAGVIVCTVSEPPRLSLARNRVARGIGFTRRRQLAKQVQATCSPCSLGTISLLEESLRVEENKKNKDSSANGLVFCYARRTLWNRCKKDWKFLNLFVWISKTDCCCCCCCVPRHSVKIFDGCFCFRVLANLARLKTKNTRRTKAVSSFDNLMTKLPVVSSALLKTTEQNASLSVSRINN